MYNSTVNGQLVARGGHFNFVPNPANFAALAMGTLNPASFKSVTPIAFGTTQYKSYLPQNSLVLHVFYRQGTVAFSSGALVNVGSDPILATPTAPTVTPTGGAAASYSYVLVALDVDGQHSAASSAGSTTTGPTTLSAAAYNTVSFTPVAAVYQYAVYRSVGGATQGKIGTVVTAGSTTAQAFRDIGQTGDGTTAPNANNSGIDIVSAQSITASADVIPAASALVSPVQTQAGVALGVQQFYISLTGTLTAGNGSLIVEYVPQNSAVYSGQAVQL